MIKFNKNLTLNDKIKKKDPKHKKKRSSKNSPAVLGWVCLTHVLGPMFLSFFLKKKIDNMSSLFVLKKITCLV